jgi:hypothetical protein
LVAAIARYEPDALLRIARILGDERAVPIFCSPPGPAVELARAWLAFTGHGGAAEASPPERVFGFAFPATMTIRSEFKHKPIVTLSLVLCCYGSRLLRSGG